MSLLHLIDYFGHNVTSFQYQNNQKGLTNKNKTNITDLHLSYDISDGTLEDDGNVFLFLVRIKLSATAEDKSEVFFIEAEYQSLFKVGEIGDIKNNFFKENEWFFTKFIHRSGRRVLETLLSNTEYKNIHIPSFLPVDLLKS